jgi:hypothetical protein
LRREESGQISTFATMKMIQKSALFLAAMLIIAAAAYLHKDSYRLFPMHVHAWAQADHLALSEGFIENGYDLFHPQTYVLNPQFPNDFKVAYPTSITAADMPFHAFIVAVIMGVSGIHDPVVFRLYTLIWSLIGLFFLYRLALNITSRPIWGLFITSAAAFSPVFVYYQDGFLPSIPCLTAVLIGLTNYFKYLESHRKSQLYFALFWLMMAALWRSSYSIALIALICTEGFRAIRDKHFELKKWIVLILPTIPILLYMLYNMSLRTEFGSIFLSSPKPPGNWQDFKDIADIAFHHWGPDYFSKWQWLFILPSLGIGLIVLLNKVIHLRQISLKEIYTLGFTTGCVCFTFLMFQQFSHHDYYFIDTLFLPILLLSSFGLSKIPLNKIPYSRIALIFVLVLLAGKAFMNADLTQKRRHTTEPWDRYTTTAINFKDSQQLLDSIGIPANSKILVIDAYAPNIPLMLMKRKGFVVLNTIEEELRNGLTFPYDYVAFQNDYLLSDVITVVPDFVDRFKFVGGNSQIGIYEIRNEKSPQTLEDFLGLSTRILLLESSFDDSTSADKYWQNIKLSKVPQDSASTEGEIIGKYEGEISFHAGDLHQYQKSIRQMLFTMEVYVPQSGNLNLELVEHIHKAETTSKYLSFSLQPWLKENGKWNKVSLLFSPAFGGLKGDEEVKLILKNPDGSEVLYRSMKVKLYH